MTRLALAFYLALAAWLAGFGIAAVTSGAPGAVTVGALGLLATLACAAVRIDADNPRTGRTGARRWPR